jgi:hypothetical protein
MSAAAFLPFNIFQKAAVAQLSKQAIDLPAHYLHATPCKT